VLVEKMLVRGPSSVFGCGIVGSYNQSGGSFTNQGSTPTNGPNKGTTTVGQPSRTRVTTGPKCFRCGDPGHRIADCRKRDKYGKGLLIDLGGAFEEQGDEEE
jgi:hypothetical protein